ncbi:hypothetical protein ACFV1N_39620 [Streptosporangium canum]|uniref:hypothetical protein n=1 Tax=Streptosporangium canum TaxID=324952 RepID=UPI00367F1523
MAFLGLINKTLQQTEAEAELITGLRDLEIRCLADNKPAVDERIGKTKGRVAPHTAAAHGGAPRATIEQVLAEQATQAQEYVDGPHTPAPARMITRTQKFSAAFNRWMERFGVQSGAVALLPGITVTGMREWAAAKVAALTEAGGTTVAAPCRGHQ